MREKNNQVAEQITGKQAIGTMAEGLRGSNRLSSKNSGQKIT